MTLENQGRQFNFKKLEDRIASQQFDLDEAIHNHAELYKEAVRASQEYIGGKLPLEHQYFPVIAAVLEITDSAVKGMSVLELGCGSPRPYQYQRFDVYPPVVSEVLTRLGAKVRGFDYRPNKWATYEHKKLDFIKTPKEKVLEQISGLYDLVVAHHLTGFGLEGDAEEKCIERIQDMVGHVALPGQLVLADQEIEIEHAIPVLRTPFDFTVWMHTAEA